MYETLTYEKKENVAIITLNRPEVLNALNDQSFPEISKAFGEADDDPAAVQRQMNKNRSLCKMVIRSKKTFYTQQQVNI